MQFIPPAKKTFTFTDLIGDGEQISLTIPMMGTVFMLCGDTCYIWAIKQKTFTANAPIYHVPLPNIYGSGNICMGVENTLSSYPEGLERLAKAWEIFVTAPFNNHLVDGKSHTNPQDIRQKLLQLQKSNRYPLNDLVPYNTSVRAAINMVINR